MSFKSKIKETIKTIIDFIFDYFLIFFLGFALILMFIAGAKQDEGIENIKKEIESTYSISVVNDAKFREAALFETERKSFSIESLDPNDDTEYKVFLVKQDDTYQLCKRNARGEYIALNPEHTIQDLKEN